MPKGNLAAVICGYEHGGTTVILDILRQHPNLTAGFECGFLHCDSPRAFIGFQPYYRNLQVGWRVQPADIQYICDTDKWVEIYKRLAERSTFVASQASTPAYLIDKTPSYMKELPQVINKLRDIPIIVVVRDPRALFHSWTKRLGPLDIETWTARYLEYAHSLERALKHQYANIRVIRHEEFCLNTSKVMQSIFDFVGFDYSDDYLLIKGKHPNTYGSTVSYEYTVQYKQTFTPDQCQLILDKTKQFQQWHWNL